MGCPVFRSHYPKADFSRIEASTSSWPGFVPAIHVLTSHRQKKTWMPGTRPGMTKICTKRPRHGREALNQNSRGGPYLSLIHISEPTRLGMISYAVFCLKKKKKTLNINIYHTKLTKKKKKKKKTNKKK